VCAAVFDAVVCGQDKPFIGALLWPSPAGTEGAGRPTAGRAPHVTKACARMVAAEIKAEAASIQRNAGRRLVAPQVARFSAAGRRRRRIDAGEITDKGYVNQRETQANRAAEVASLFAAELAPGVVPV
jgi:feruloyl-CoA synthase